MAAVGSKIGVLDLAMETRGFWCLAGVSDRELQSSLGALLESGARTEARIVAHLAEVEERRLHLRAGSSSMFDYCTKRLELSENEAFHRIAASRAARQFPIVFTLLERREVHLTAICLLREHLTRENHAELLAEAAHKTKRQIQELIARRFPTPDAESRIRKLPERQARVANTGLAIAGVPVPVTAAPVLAVQEVMAPTAAIPVSPPLAEPMPSRPSPSPASAPPPVRGVIEPTSAARYRIQLNASAALKEKLDLLRALTSHSNPEGDLAAVIELAVDVALDKVQRDRFAKTERPRRSSGHRGIQTTEKSRKRARVPASIQREIAIRDGLRCTYVGERGHRCGARAFLQIHHERPWARGGAETAENLRLLCASHNRLLAEQDFGVTHVAGRIAARREQSALHPEDL